MVNRGKIIGYFKYWNNILVVVVGLLVAHQTITSAVAPVYNDSIYGQVKRLLEDMRIYGKVVQAETDIDVVVHNLYGLELYHCNKDKNGHFKYSFILINGRPYEAKESRIKRCWVYDKNGNGDWTPIKTLKQ